ncbi:Gfo/Idh/MocA family protein [Microbacterium sp. SLBN-146]|uniref:Gfo/Idh/MocA family protein n=1 Tax=Microbacterium sp. SLBN-146 TaxID=2768457 RepID=UPI001171874E|nr:Gfo/Idh/MocA family oxidoreductase [Microbacterium sp. SLBN-146]TQJ29905.1 putative dehydrogenase [Microbacterium sp. SLBN-146]
MNNQTIGVGIIGSGSVVQGIHLPTLARCGEEFAVRHIMDVDLDAARSVAGRVGARASGSVDELLSEPDVDVVAVCSPHAFHSDHVIAACRAGVSVVLCEKPFATTVAQAREMAQEAERSGTRIVVGAMHAFDPAWAFSRDRAGDVLDRATVIRSSIVLPFNDRYESWSTEVAQASPVPERDVSTPEARAAQITARILGLGIHDIPLVRSVLPDWRELEVASATILAPLGYAVTLRSGRRVVQLIGSFRDHGEPEWEFEAVASDASVHIAFAPSYVQAGSGTATVRRGATAEIFAGSARNGYEEEWRHVADLVREPRMPTRSLADLVDDLAFAIDVAERAGEHLRHAGATEGSSR